MRLMHTKQKIYEVAKILFLEEGYNNVSNKKIAEVSGVNQGLITYYFKQKSNISSTIIKENYQIISSYLRNEVDVNQEPFLFNITIDYLMCTLASCSTNLTQFIWDMANNNVLLDTVFSGSQKNDIIIMIKKYIPNSKGNINKNFKKFVIMTFPAALKFQLELINGTDFSLDEYYEIMVGLFAFSLNIDFDDTIFNNYITRSKTIVNKIVQEHPFLKSPENYLYNKNIFTPTIVDELLDL